MNMIALSEHGPIFTVTDALARNLASDIAKGFLMSDEALVGFLLWLGFATWRAIYEVRLIARRRRALNGRKIWRYASVQEFIATLRRFPPKRIVN